MASIDKVLILGAGIGGLGAAAALGQQGIDVDVVEIKPEAKVYGVGINQPANSLRALDQLGVLPEILAAGYQFDRWIFHDYLGNVVVDVPSKLGGPGVPANCALPRRELQRVLIGAATEAGARIRYGLTAADLREEEGRVTVDFSTGEEATYDLVVAFDGIKSPMRKRLFGGDYEPVYTGHVVWRVTVPRPPELNYGALYQSPRTKAGHIPLTDETMYLLEVSPEPADARYPKEQFADLLRERLDDFEGVIGDIRDNLKDDDDIVYSPLSEVLLPEPWHRGRVVLGGDAAHACTPHITQGAAMALEDAVVLAEELAGEADVEGALTAYSQRRYPRVKFVQQVSRGILDAEMATTAATLASAIEHMAADLPGQFGHVDEFLNQPA